MIYRIHNNKQNVESNKHDKQSINLDYNYATADSPLAGATEWCNVVCGLYYCTALKRVPSRHHPLIDWKPLGCGRYEESSVYHRYRK